jgi:hypothetical protein
MAKRTKRRKKRKSSQQRQHQPKNNPLTVLHQAEGAFLKAAAIKPAEHDRVFTESGHFLSRDMRTRLRLAQVLVGLENVPKQLDGQHDVPVSTNISFTALSEPILDQLEKRGVPARGNLPFNFDYDLLALYLPRQVRVNLFYEAFIELVLNEWKINFARKFFVALGFEEWAKQQSGAHQPMKNIAALHGRRLYQEMIDLKTMRGLWFASEGIIRIRAQWDKLVKQFVAEKYLCIKGPGRFDPACRKIRKHRSQLQTESQTECLTALVTLAEQADDLRRWRDDDLHQFSQTVFGVLNRSKTHRTLGSLWDMVVEEHNRVREAMIAAIGIVMLGSPTSSSLHFGGKWPSPTRYIDFNDPEDAARHGKMVALVERLLALHRKLAAATIPADKELYQRQIETTDRRIDALVYELYGLTREETEVVEG